MDPGPLVVICGPTASGKTDLAIELAEEFDGEIICADSRTVYRETDIGTAKPSVKQQAAVPHHLLDIVNVGEKFTIFDFKNRAVFAIKRILSRGRVPFLVGGSGLYIDSVIYDFKFRNPGDKGLREKLNKKSVTELQSIIKSSGKNLPENTKNPRHLIRKIESSDDILNQSKLRKNTLLIGMELDKDLLEKRITKRTKKMFDKGLITEVERLDKKYRWQSEELNIPLYPAARLLIEKKISLEEAVEYAVKSDLKLVKKQMTWFKRNQNIDWINSFAKAEKLVETFLSK